MLYEIRRTKALSGITVVDASSNEGAYAGKLLADMGAKVVRFQPAADAAGSASAFFNLGKEVIVADFGLANDVDRFRTAVSEADVVLESFTPAMLEKFDIGPEPFRTANPGLIWAKISPFGTTGPYSSYKSSDLTNMALGGMLALAGYPDREPVLAAGDQSFKIASLYGAVAILIAYYERLGSSKGQYIQIPIQHAVTTALENSIQFYDLQGVVRKRTGPGYAEAASGLFRCSDGLVFLMAGRLSTLRGWKALTTWLTEELPGVADDLLQPQWDDQTWKATPEASARFEAIFSEFAKSRTKQELYLEAQKRGIAMCPVNSVSDVLEDQHLKARYFFRPVRLGGGQEVRLPGVPYRLSKTPASLAIHAEESIAYEA